MYSFGLHKTGTIMMLSRIITIVASYDSFGREKRRNVAQLVSVRSSMRRVTKQCAIHLHVMTIPIPQFREQDFDPLINSFWFYISSVSPIHLNHGIAAAYERPSPATAAATTYSGITDHVSSRPQRVQCHTSRYRRETHSDLSSR